MEINNKNIEEWILCSVDKELSREQEAVLKKYLRLHPEMQLLYDNYASTRQAIQAQRETIQFADKEMLMGISQTKRANGINKHWLPTSGLKKMVLQAAALILLLGTGIWLYLQSAVESKRMVQSNNNNASETIAALNIEPSIAKDSFLNTNQTIKNLSNKSIKMQHANVLNVKQNEYISKRLPVYEKRYKAPPSAASKQNNVIPDNMDAKIMQQNNEPVICLEVPKVNPINSTAFIQRKLLPTLPAEGMAVVSNTNNINRMLALTKDLSLEENGNKWIANYKNIKKNIPMFQKAWKEFQQDGITFEVEFASAKN